MSTALADPSTIKRWREQPDLYVRERFGVEPDPWQLDVLRDFPACPRQAMQACKGPGKTSTLAWLGWNFLETRPHPKGAAVSITKDNLRDNLWAEMAKWRQRAPALLEHFEWTTTRIFHKPYPETWFIAARGFSQSATNEQLAATLAGLHADYIIFIIDESGGIPPAVVVTADAALSSCKEGHILQAGNPLLHSGALYMAVKAEKAKWKVYEITGDPDDPKRSPRVSIEWAKEQIAEYGRDNPYVLINVFGKFSSAAVNALLSIDEVEAAVKRNWREHDIRDHARILGIDVARYGDDSSIIFPRQGLVAFPPKRYRNINSTEGAGLAAHKIDEWGADATFIDDTGGYGSGWIDNLNRLGHAPIGVQFSGKALEAHRYANKRAEMHFLKAEWIRKGGQIPDEPQLIQALSKTTYTHQGDRMIIEPKDQLKARLGFSPDEDDALGLTFAQPVARRAAQIPGRNRSHYDPYALAPMHGQPANDYNPYALH